MSALGTAVDAVNGGEAVGTNIWAYAPNGSQAQKYYLYYVDGDYCRIESMKSGFDGWFGGGFRF